MRSLKPDRRHIAGLELHARSTLRAASALLRIEAAGWPPGSILRCFGEIDLSSVDCLTQALAASIEAGVLEMEVDLREVDYLDSSALKALLWAQRQLERRGSKLILRAGPRVEHLCRLVGLDRVLEIRSD